MPRDERITMGSFSAPRRSMRHGRINLAVGVRALKRLEGRRGRVDLDELGEGGEVDLEAPRVVKLGHQENVGEGQAVSDGVLAAVEAHEGVQRRQAAAY